MQRKIWNIFGYLSLAALAILIGASPAYADNPVTFSITGLSGNLWGEYTSPYATDNVGTVACDDIRDTVNMNTPYTYNAVSANSIVSSGSGGIWSGAPNPYANNTQKLYAAAADLALDIFHSTGVQQEYASWALWMLIDQHDAWVTHNLQGQIDQAGCAAIFGASAWSGGHCSDSTAYGDGLVGAAIASGISDFNANSFNGLTVYVPKNANGSAWCNSNDSSCQSQEFWNLVPDGGTALMYLTVAGLSCFGAMYQRNRRLLAEGADFLCRRTQRKFRNCRVGIVYKRANSARRVRRRRRLRLPRLRPCAGCGKLLCACCDQFHCDGCGHRFCIDHLVSVPDGTPIPLHCCPECAAECEQLALPAPLPPIHAMQLPIPAEAA